MPDLLEQCIDSAHAGDARPFMENYLTVSAKDNQLVPFRFNRLQEHVHKHATGRDFWVKYRQGGSSLYWLGKGTTFALTIPYFNFAVITLSTDKGKTAERLFRHVKRFIDNLPQDMKPSLGHSQAGYIDLDVLQSQIYVGTVGSREFGRSETIHMLMVTELGLFTPAEAQSVTTAAVESVPPGGIIVFETTPRYIGSYAHSFYLDCKRGRKPYNTGFVPWYWAEDYWLPPGSPEALPADQGRIVLTDEERKLASHFLQDGTAVEDRIRWRRAKMADRGNDFFSEYPEDDVGCWLAATTGVFPAERLRKMLLDVKEPDERYGCVRIYKASSPIRQYVCGVDGSGGLPDGDPAGAVVQCADTGEVVAVVHGHIGPEGMARELAELSLKYNRMMIGGERDAWTLQILTILERLGCNVFYEDDGSKEPKFGFANTHSSRLQAVAVLRAALLQNDFICYDEQLVQELMQYQKEVSESRSALEKYSAPVGLHDDLCVAAQRAQQIRLSVPIHAVYAPKPDVTQVSDLYPAGRW